ncbi:MAG TPA: hypothetical protein VK141_02530 [Nitrosomonas sp.]|nr:hypothetical protein [Nitrosomonas sp.]
MITNPNIVAKFEVEQFREETLPLPEKFAILNGMYELAVTLHRFPPTDILEGIEHSIHLAKILNSRVPQKPF